MLPKFLNRLRTVFAEASRVLADDGIFCLNVGDGEPPAAIWISMFDKLSVTLFTHQSGSIWADMANIVWASDLHMTAAWYVVTETENALHEGSYVKGTVLLVLRKRAGTHKTTRDEMGNPGGGSGGS